MVVLPRLDFEPRSRTGVTHLACYADSDQRFENTIHGRARDPRKPGAHIVEDLVGRGMIVTPYQGLQYRPSLNRDG
jgi:hypothetical protein